MAAQSAFLGPKALTLHSRLEWVHVLSVPERECARKAVGCSTGDEAFRIGTSLKSLLPSALDARLRNRASLSIGTYQTGPRLLYLGGRERAAFWGFEPRKLTGRPWYSTPRPLLCDRCLQYSRYGMYVLSNPVGPVRGLPDPRVTAGDGQTSCSPRIPLRSLCDSRTTV
jgi:hypothetical protein